MRTAKGVLGLTAQQVGLGIKLFYRRGDVPYKIEDHQFMVFESIYQCAYFGKKAAKNGHLKMFGSIPDLRAGSTAKNRN